MKKAVKIAIPVLVAVIVVTSLISRSDMFFLDDRRPTITSSAEPEKVLDYYLDVVEKTTKEKNFKLDITTMVKFNKIDCSIAILNPIMKRLIDYTLGELEDEVSSYTFKDGALIDDPLVVPNDVMHLIHSDFNKKYYHGISAAQVEDFEDKKSVAFIISKETATVDAVMRAINYLNKYGKMSDTPEVKALVPTHTNFIDITSVVRSMQNMLLKNNNSSEAKEEETPDFAGENGSISQISGGLCSLGDTSIMCDINNNSCLQSLEIYAPVSVQASIKFMNRDIEANMQVDVVMKYNFNYDI